GYKRDEAESGQLSKWTTKTNPARDAFAATYKMGAGVYAAVPRATTLDVSNPGLLVGGAKDIGDVARRPKWDDSGTRGEFQVDHIVELQLGGKDELENYQLLEAKANQSSGSSIKVSINEELAKMTDKEGGDPDKIKAKYNLEFSDFTEVGPAAAKTWELE